MSTVHGKKAFGLAEHWCDFSLLSLEEPSPTHLGWLFGFVSLWRFPLALSCACVCVEFWIYLGMLIAWCHLARSNLMPTEG